MGWGRPGCAVLEPEGTHSGEARQQKSQGLAVDSRLAVPGGQRVRKGLRVS